MAILITRPLPQGKTLTQQLTQRGVTAFHHPLICIEQNHQAVDDFLEKLSSADVVIFVSQHAVTYAHHAVTSQRKAWPLHPTYFAIGESTATYFHELTKKSAHYPTHSDSENLLQLTKLQHISNKRVLIVRGNGGRELIYDKLSTRGASVFYSNIYQRVHTPPFTRATIEHWQQYDLDKVVITSGEQLDIFVAHIPDEFKKWAMSLKIYIPSERIAQKARYYGFTHIENTLSANNQILLDKLIK